MKKFSFVFGFRNRDIVRVKRCFDSLAAQRVRNFNVLFTDYGSDNNVSSEVSALCMNYSFVRYVKNETSGLPWNRSHALNTGVRLAQTEYIIFGDVDMIYSSEFTATIENEAKPEVNLYGENYQLTETFNEWDALNHYDTTKLELFGSAGKGGVHIVSKSALDAVGGYDEYYCYWGVEDRDLHWRLTQFGLAEKWITNQAPVFHQWHPLTSDFYTSGFPLQWWEDVNVYFETNKGRIQRNEHGWGKIYTAEDRPSINSSSKRVEVELKCRDAVFGDRSKSAVISEIFRYLNNIKRGEIAEFSYVMERSHESWNNISPKQIFSTMLVPKANWVQMGKQWNRYSRRLNHFIPDEDLIYIFREIVRCDTRFDYSFSVRNDKYLWCFALK